MAKKFTLSFLLLLAVYGMKTQAQTPPPHHFYLASGGEWIFSLSDLDAGDVNTKAVVRFSPFFNVQMQIHYDFTNSVGLYSGLGIRNIGFINKLADTIRIKERSYSLGLPLVLKLGNMQKGFDIGLGAEVEWMFAWKRKVFVNDSKTKYSDWFSNNVNPINPSLLLEVKFYKGQYVRFKYYLDDFLKYKPGGLTLPNGAGTLPDYALSSKMFYLSIGTTITKQPIGHHASTKTSNASTDAYFKEVSQSKKN